MASLGNGTILEVRLKRIQSMRLRCGLQEQTMYLGFEIRFLNADDPAVDAPKIDKPDLDTLGEEN